MNDKFFIKDNKICLNTHKVVVRRYLDINKTDYVDETHCVDSDGLHELEVNFVPKHKLISVSYTHLRAHETDSYLVCRLLLEKKK